MTALLYALNVLCSAGQSTLCKVYARHGGKSDVFNLWKALSAFALFLCIGLVRGMTLHAPTALMGALYGISLCASMYTGFAALASGPMGLTGTIASLSLVIPFLFGVTVWKEPLTVSGLCGAALLTAAILLMNLRKERGVTLRWSLLAFGTMAANGVCSLIQKSHQLRFPGQYRVEFTIFAFLTVFLLLAAIGLSRKEPISFTPCPAGCAVGVLNGGANFLVLYLAATQNASVLFPMLSVTNVLAVCLIGRLCFREKLTRLQLLGLLSAVAAILLLNL